MGANTATVRGWMIGLAGIAARGRGRHRGPAARPFRADGTGPGRAAAGDRRPRRRRDLAGGRPRRRVLLGRAGRLPARRGRHQRGLRLCRRRQGERALRVRRPRRHRPRRGRCGSPSIRARSATARCCRSSSRSRTTRPSSTARGPDVGHAVPVDDLPDQRRAGKVAKAYIDQLNAARAFDGPIVTTIEPDRPFYPAEDYHQDYLTRHPDQPYIVINDLPKIAELKRLFPARYRETPVLVRARRR